MLDSGSVRPILQFIEIDARDLPSFLTVSRTIYAYAKSYVSVRVHSFGAAAVASAAGWRHIVVTDAELDTRVSLR